MSSWFDRVERNMKLAKSLTEGQQFTVDNTRLTVVRTKPDTYTLVNLETGKEWYFMKYVHEYDLDSIQYLIFERAMVSSWVFELIEDKEAKKYRKKPIVIEAYQTDKVMYIETSEGTMKANVGDYIITGVNGEQYPCKPDIFNKTYEMVSE